MTITMPSPFIDVAERPADRPRNGSLREVFRDKRFGRLAFQDHRLGVRRRSDEKERRQCQYDLVHRFYPSSSSTRRQAQAKELAGAGREICGMVSWAMDFPVGSPSNSGPSNAMQMRWVSGPCVGPGSTESVRPSPISLAGRRPDGPRVIPTYDPVRPTHFRRRPTQNTLFRCLSLNLL